MCAQDIEGCGEAMAHALEKASGLGAPHVRYGICCRDVPASGPHAEDAHRSGRIIKINYLIDSVSTLRY